MQTSKIIGTGRYIPTRIKKNEDFLKHNFHNEKMEKLPTSNEIIINKFKAITGIDERKYLAKDLINSDMGTIAAKKALENSGIDPEELDYIIVAHNFGDIKYGTTQTLQIPSIASRIKHNLQIENPNCVAYDILFGCPGWVEAIIQTQAFIKAGMAKKCLVIGSETLERIADPYDRDFMIYSDGAGACIVEATEEGNDGVLSHASQSFTKDEAHFLYMSNSYNPNEDQSIGYMKMNGRKIYEFALSNVPKAMKIALDKSGTNISSIKKILIHQANEKMDEAIVKRFYKLHNKEMPKDIMPMSINKLGNSSVATIPTLLDLILKGDLEDHKIDKGDTVIFASVGGGMNINAIVYRF